MCNNLNYSIDNPAEFLRGQRDAKNGNPTEIGACESYNRGFETIYIFEQVQTESNLQQERLMSIFG